MFTYDLTDEDYALPYNAPGSSKSYFELDDEFRNFVPKRRSDAIKLETILGNSGDVDLETVGGPTGLSGEALDKGIRAYQRRNGLAVDGWVRPGGPTITKMKEQFGGLLGDYEAPSPKQSDTHHRMRDAGHQGFLKAKRQDLLLPPIPGLPKPNENMRGGNHSLVRTVRDKGMQQTPDYMANLVRRQGQDGVVEARDFVDQLDKLMPGEGTKAIRGILQSLADIPGLQRAFFGGPVIEIAPIGVFEQDGPRRYEQAIKTRPWEAHEQGRKIPGDGEVRDAAYRPERDDVGLTERKLPYRPDAEAGKYEAIPLRATGSTEDAGAEAEASPTPNDLLDPRNWPEAYRSQALSSQNEPLQAEATATDKEAQDAHAIQTAQGQGQPQRPPQGQQQRPQQPQTPPRQGQQQQRPQRPGQTPQQQGPSQGQNQQARPNLPAQPQPSAAARRPQSENVPAFRLPGQEYRNEISRLERSGLGSVNPDTGAMGRYQILRGTLVDAGLKNKDGSWRPGNPLGITSDEEFLKSAEAQERAFDMVSRRYHEQLRANGSFDRVGKTIQGLNREIVVTEAGLAGAAHRTGAGTVSSYFRRLERHDWNSTAAFAELEAESLAQLPANPTKEERAAHQARLDRYRETETRFGDLQTFPLHNEKRRR